MRATPLVLVLLAAASPAWGAASSVPPELEAAHVAADAAYRAGDYRGAASRCRDILADLGERPAQEAPEDEWKRTLLQLALAESTVGNATAARGALDQVLAIDPSAQLDPELFSPAFRREFEQARQRVAARPRLELTVTTRSGKGRAFIQGRPFGDVPAAAALPTGTYRVGVEDGGGSRTVTVELARNESMVLDVAAPPPDLSALPPPVSLSVAPPRTGDCPTAWATTGLAVTAAGLATWQGVLAAGSSADAKAMLLPDGSLKPGIDPATYAAQVSEFDAQRTRAWVAAGSAVALGAGATVLWLLVPSAPIEPAPGGAAIRF
jgi:hypothetical protein